jgi:uncharacterized protein YfaS (alpha-2-macroglobulin family)
LQAPRFFVVGDKVTVSAVVNNRSGKQLRPTVQLEAAGSKLVSPASQSVLIDAGSDARVDWVLNIAVPGRANLKVVAWDGSFRDAMEKSYPAFEHGIEKALYTAGKNRDGSIVRSFELPPRKADTTEFIVQVTPSLAVTMLDALPYLIDYPYGCTEQTMSRFLPTAIVSRTLGNLGLEPEEVLGRVFGGVVPDHSARTHLKGRKNLEHLDRMIEQGLQRLYDFQHSDGGWGWWKEGESDHFMTAYVLWGLSMAREAEIDLRGDVLSRAVSYLDKELVERESSHDLQAWMLHSLTFHASKSGSSSSRFQRTAFDNLWDVRDRLNAYSRALLALSAHQMGRAQEARILIENLENGAIRDEQPQNSRFLSGQTSQADALATAHWGNDGIYYRWSEGGVEATSFVLKALLTIDPDHALVEPTLNWLIKNRRGAQWSNTRDTAIVVLTLTDYLGQSGELEESVGFRVTVNGQEIAERSLRGSDLLTAPSRFRVDPALIQDHNQVQIRRTHGSAPLYYALEARFFSREEPIQAAGNEVFVQRSYYRLVPRATLLNGHVLERELLKPGQSIASGDRLEVVLRIEAKNHYEYLLFEDLKPAGLEAVALKSGGPFFVQQLKAGALNAGSRTAKSTLTSEQLPSMTRFTGQRRWVHRELRDRKVALFIDKLPEGFWEMRYELRAEVPGDFHALPLLGLAMYVPEIRANGEEMQLRILDSKLLTDD